MREKIENFDEAISGTLLYEIATLLLVARNDVSLFILQCIVFT
nr:hypothetical protein [Rickettsia hoogstraalii]